MADRRLICIVKTKRKDTWEIYKTRDEIYEKRDVNSVGPSDRGQQV